jgi:hypothetical protein
VRFDFRGHGRSSSPATSRASRPGRRSPRC